MHSGIASAIILVQRLYSIIMYVACSTSLNTIYERNLQILSLHTETFNTEMKNRINVNRTHLIFILSIISLYKTFHLNIHMHYRLIRKFI